MASKAKHAPKNSSTGKLPPVDVKTRGLIVELADEVASAAEKRRETLRAVEEGIVAGRILAAVKVGEHGGE